MKKFMLYLIVVISGMIAGGPIVAIISFFTLKYLIKKNRWFNKNNQEELVEHTDDDEFNDVIFYTLIFNIATQLKIGKEEATVLTWDNFWRVRDDGFYGTFNTYNNSIKDLKLKKPQEAIEFLRAENYHELIELILSALTYIFYPKFGKKALKLIDVYAEVLNFSIRYNEIKKLIIENYGSDDDATINKKSDNKSDPYMVLGCSPSDSTEDIKKAYRKKISEYHPDKIQGKGLPQDFIDFANEQTKVINAAYEYIVSIRN